MFEREFDLDAELETDLGTVILRTFEREFDLATCIRGTDSGRSKAEIEEMEFKFTLPPAENPYHYQY